MLGQIASLPPEQQQAAIQQLSAAMGVPPAALAGLIGAAAGAGAGGFGGPAAPPGGTVVSLTAAEGAQIDAIIQQGKDMGFEWQKQKVLQAYIVCDKNMEMTVNYLLNSD
jgi:hypothetical protein